MLSSPPVSATRRRTLRIIEKPQVTLIARPALDGQAIHDYLERVGGLEWYNRVFVREARAKGIELATDPAAALVEFCGRLCYRSWDVGLNPNVTRVREDSAAYLRNILSVGHGSVLEHAQFSFIFEDVSRVFTHEQVRHRAGVALSQESMRFVRLDDIPFWFPEWCREDEELMRLNVELLHHMESHQAWMADHFGLDDEGVDFAEKKFKTSFMRRFAPIGVGTSIVVSANIRAIRHMITMRNSEHAEEEIQLLYREVAALMIEECPLLFGDFQQDPETGEYRTEFEKV